MGKGRKAKPLAEHLAHGNPSKKKLNFDEPKFGGSPECPSWLTPLAQAEWERITTAIEHLDMLTAADQALLANYCQAYARWRQAEQQIEREGAVINEPMVNKAGDIVGHKVKRHPAVMNSKDAQLMMQRAASLFGFDPSNRTKIHLPEAQDKPNAISAEDADLYVSGEDEGPTVH